MAYVDIEERVSFSTVDTSPMNSGVFDRLDRVQAQYREVYMGAVKQILVGSIIGAIVMPVQ